MVRVGKKKKVARKKNSPRKILSNACVKLWGLCVRARDRHICQYNYCGKPANNPHHIFTKGGHPMTKYDLENGITLCVYCHRAIAHGKPQMFERFIIKRIGQKKYDLLQFRAYSSGKNDLAGIKLYLTAYLKGEENE